MEWKPIGPHLYCIDGDIVLWKGQGEITVAHHTELFGLVMGIVREYGHAGMVAWADREMILGPEARRNHGVLLKQHKPRVAMVLLGAGTVQRALGRMMITAAQLISGLDLPMHFCKTEAEGRAWLAATLRPRSALQK